MWRVAVLAVIAGLCPVPLIAQPSAQRLPVIDMHVHSGNSTPEQARARMQALNIRYVFVGALASDLPAWADAMTASDYLPSVAFPCPDGRALFGSNACWEGSHALPDTSWLREELRTKRIQALGELTPQFMGITPNDIRLEPYWRLAEEFDVPVAIHMGPGPPAVAYESSPSPRKFPDFQMGANNPLLLEEVLLRHKRLRILVMHAGWPFLDGTLALLYAHPNVYVDLGALQAEFMVPRASYFRYLRDLVEAGFGKRIVFGSDFPNQVEPGIEAILATDFLTADQKADILCGNAARFLRLPASVCEM
jgi:uncharacterized protein